MQRRRLQLVWESLQQVAAEEKHHSAQRILPCVREHACAQTAPRHCEHAEECAVKRDQQHAADALIAVCEPEEHSGDRDAKPGVAGKRGELLLQIAAEDQLFAEAC